MDISSQDLRLLVEDLSQKLHKDLQEYEGVPYTEENLEAVSEKVKTRLNNYCNIVLEVVPYDNEYKDFVTQVIQDRIINYLVVLKLEEE